MDGIIGRHNVPGALLPGDQVGDGVARDTDGVPDASRISPPVLLPGFPNPVRLSLVVDVDLAGLPPVEPSASLHATVTEETASGFRVRVEPGARVDRDFLLRLRFADADVVRTSLAVRPDEGGEGGTFALTVLPPSARGRLPSRDVVLVLDRSGSMRGWKVVAARRAASRVVDSLRADDRFAVLAFDDRLDSPDELPAGLVAATDRNRYRAVEFLAGLEARGGTEMLNPLQRAAGLLGAEGDRERVLVLVTDGQVGDEDRLLREVGTSLAGVRVHTVGIDRAVNAAFAACGARSRRWRSWPDPGQANPSRLNPTGASRSGSGDLPFPGRSPPPRPGNGPPETTTLPVVAARYRPVIAVRHPTASAAKSRRRSGTPADHPNR